MINRWDLRKKIIIKEVKQTEPGNRLDIERRRKERVKDDAQVPGQADSHD